MTFKLFQQKIVLFLLTFCVSHFLFLPNQLYAQSLPTFNFNSSIDSREKVGESKAYIDQFSFLYSPIGDVGELSVLIQAGQLLLVGSPLGVTASGEVIKADYGSRYVNIRFCDKALEQKYQGLKCADSVQNMTMAKIRHFMSEEIIRVAKEIGQEKGVSAGFLIKRENIMLPVYQ